MHKPPAPRDRPAWNHPTWSGILVGYAMITAFLLSLWVVSHPVMGTLSIAAVAGLAIGARRLYRVVPSISTCRRFTFCPSRDVQVTVTVCV
ncbi:MAG: hypothetical protein ACI8UR_000635 [Natronomonas sp.]|jgi:hypothetical protein|uniref:hypothetical protein n=1 Tax=Natronomonas sp. TaxID=2184060 RepID=UPI0039899AE0